MKHFIFALALIAIPAAAEGGTRRHPAYQRLSPHQSACLESAAQAIVSQLSSASSDLHLVRAQDGTVRAISDSETGLTYELVEIARINGPAEFISFQNENELLNGWGRVLGEGRCEITETIRDLGADD